MKTISNKLTVGKEHAGLDLYCELKMDGKTVDRFRSRSFLGSFAHMLQGLMHGGPDWKLGVNGYYSSYSDGRSNSMSTYDYWIIQESSADSPMTVKMKYTNFFRDFRGKDEAYPNTIYIYNAPNHNGLYRGVYQGGGYVALYHLDGSPVDGSIGTAVGGTINPTIGYHRFPVTAHTSDTYWPNYTFQNWDIIVGRSDTPVSVEDVYLWDRISPGSGDGQLSHGAKSTSPIVTDKPTSRFTMSKAFTNHQASDVVVRELAIVTGLATGNSDVNDAVGQGYSMVRDTLDSPLTIPTGRTLTVDYELVVRLSPDTLDTDIDGTNGGFVQSFMESIRSCTFRSFGNKVRLSLAGGVGLTSMSNNPDIRPWEYGIRLGDDNTFVSMTDTSLNLDDGARNGFDHGSGDGQLYHYGNDVSLVEYDTLANKALFSVSRIFENKGAVALDIREIGLFANTAPNSSQTSTSHLSGSPTLIARTALHPTDQFTIQPGEYKKVKYIIEVIA